jgi:hypothetical protein
VKLREALQTIKDWNLPKYCRTGEGACSEYPCPPPTHTHTHARTHTHTHEIFPWWQIPCSPSQPNPLKLLHFDNWRRFCEGKRKTEASGCSVSLLTDTAMQGCSQVAEKLVAFQKGLCAIYYWYTTNSGTLITNDYWRSQVKWYKTIKH